MVYADLEELIADYFPKAKDEEKVIVETLLKAASARIDSYTEKPSGYFLPSPEIGTTIRRRGTGTNCLQIPTHVKDTVSVDGIDVSNYYEGEKDGFLYLIEKGDLNTSPQPGWVMEWSPRTIAEVSTWLKNYQFKITARWGYAETPEDIKEAARKLTLRWYQSAKDTFKGLPGAIKTESGVIYERFLPADVQGTLDKYK